MKAFFFITVMFFSLPADITDDAENDRYYREIFCDPETELKELPQNFLDVCKKADVDPTTIHVYKTKSGTYMHTIGKNIMLHEDFFSKDGCYKTDDEKAFGFAHELSHTLNGDFAKKLSYEYRLYDFQIVSSLIVATHAMFSIYKQKKPIVNIMRAGALWAISNVAALYAYYQATQVFELRANDDAALFASPEAGISNIEKIKWSYETANSLECRFKWHLQNLGFCEHGSFDLQLARLKKLRKKQK